MERQTSRSSDIFYFFKGEISSNENFCCNYLFLFFCPQTATADVHAFFMCDTDIEGRDANGTRSLQAAVANDLFNLKDAFQTSIKPEKIKIYEVIGKNANYNYLKNLMGKLRNKIEKDDCVLLIYSGHGGWDKNAKFFIGPKHGPPITRSSLHLLVRQFDCRLGVLITDCCSNYAGQPEEQAASASTRTEDSIQTTALARKLFLSRRGLSIFLLQNMVRQPPVCQQGLLLLAVLLVRLQVLELGLD